MLNKIQKLPKIQITTDTDALEDIERYNMLMNSMTDIKIITNNIKKLSNEQMRKNL